MESIKKWRRGEVRKYDPIVNAGCCWCSGKDWPCRFPLRFVRVGNTAVRLVTENKRSEIEKEEEAETREETTKEEISETGGENSH